MSAGEQAAPGLAELFEQAAARGRARQLRYAGEVTPAEAWQLHQSGEAHIIDVRTRPEFEFVGHVPETSLVEWRRYGEAHPNPDFLRELSSLARFDETVLFLCRSAVRSHHAAELAAQAGYTRAFNILEGFEGHPDARGQRGHTGGWRHAGLPWVQG